MRRKHKDRARTITKAVFELIAVGAIICVADVFSQGRNSSKLLKGLVGFSVFRIRQTMRRLKLQGCIKYDEDDERAPILLTDKGFVRAVKSHFFFGENKKWDHFWRLIMFDIPESSRRRQAFQKLLLKIGCYQIQRSVYVFPFECKKEILQLAASFKVSRHVMVYTVPNLGPLEKRARDYYFQQERSR